MTALDFLQRHKWLRISICLVVALLMLCVPVLRPIVIGHALALTGGAIIAIVSTFLLFIGVTFASSEERNRVSLSYYNNSSSAFKQWVNNSAIQFPGTPPSGGNDKDPKDSGLLGAILSIPKHLMVAGAVAAAAVFTAKKGEQGKIEDTSGLKVKPWEKVIGKTINAIAYSYNYLGQDYNGNFPISVTLNQFPAGSPDIGTPITSLYPDDVYYTDYFDYISGIEAINTSQVMRLKGVSGATYNYTICATKTAEGLIVSLAENNIFVGRTLVPFSGIFDSFTVCLYPSVSEHPPSYGSGMLSFALGCEVKYVENESMKLASERSYIKGADISSPGNGHHVSKTCTFDGFVDGNTGNIAPNNTYYIPSTLSSHLAQIEKAANDANLPDDAPIQMQVPATDAALTNSPWQDVVVAQEKYIEALERRIEALETGKNPDPLPQPDPPPEPPPSGDGDASDLKLPDLKLPVDVTKLFPFCIPFDVIRAFEVFTADPIPPRFVIPLKLGDYVYEEMVIDFTPFAFAIEIVRWGELILFTVGLAVVTRNYIKW